MFFVVFPPSCESELCQRMWCLFVCSAYVEENYSSSSLLPQLKTQIGGD